MKLFPLRHLATRCTRPFAGGECGGTHADATGKCTRCGAPR